MAEQPAGEKTEKATPQRMKKLRKDGSLQRSQDVSAWLGVGAAAVMMPSVIANAKSVGEDQFRALGDVVADPSPERAVQALSDGLGSVLVSLAPVLAVVVITAIVANVAQGGLHISTKKLKPTFKQFNLINGIKRSFGTQALWQGLKALLKTIVIGVVLYSAIQGLVPVLMTSGGLTLSTIIGVAGGGLKSLVIWAVVAGLLLAAADLFVIQKRNRKQTRMTKKEISDENKQAEGDPHIKSQRRARQMAMSRNRMISNVADADVVVVNPTHVAVALKYTPGQGAPKVVATGKGAVAARIREQATEHRVPMVHDIPLARAIHAVCRVDDEIPEELFTAVAQVLAFVMALKRRGASAGQHTMAAPTPVPPTPSAAERARRRRAARAAGRAGAAPPGSDGVADSSGGTSTTQAGQTSVAGRETR